MKAAQLSGTYGDIFWALQSVTDYLANTTLAVLIYVANTTDDEHTYMISVTITDSSGTVLAVGPLTVNERTWFTLAGHEYVMLPGEIMSEFTDAILRLDLVEEISNESTDSTSTYLRKPSVAGLPIFGGVTSDSLISIMLLLMVMGMMMSMMKSISEPSEKKQLPARRP